MCSPWQSATKPQCCISQRCMPIRMRASTRSVHSSLHMLEVRQTHVVAPSMQHAYAPRSFRGVLQTRRSSQAVSSAPVISRALLQQPSTGLLLSTGPCCRHVNARCCAGRHLQRMLYTEPGVRASGTTTRSLPPLRLVPSCACCNSPSAWSWVMSAEVCSVCWTSGSA